MILKIDYPQKSTGSYLEAEEVNEIKDTINQNADELSSLKAAVNAMDLPTVTQEIGYLKTAVNNSVSALSNIAAATRIGMATPNTVVKVGPLAGEFYEARPGIYNNFGVTIPYVKDNRIVDYAKIIWTGTKWGFDLICREFTRSGDVNLPLPRTTAKVTFVNMPAYTALSETIPIRVKMVYEDPDGASFIRDVDVTYQGQFTATLPKKNFAIDLYEINGDGEELDGNIKFGDWPLQNSFHLKADYIDVTHSRNIISAKLFYNMACTRLPGERFLFDFPFNVNTSTLAARTNSGARGTIEGFPIEVYFDEEFVGLHMWNLKRHRDNFNMKKSDNKHIILTFNGLNSVELPNSFTLPEYKPDTEWEFKNPKFDGPPPQALIDSVNRVFVFMTTSSDVDFKNQIQDYIYLPSMLDYYIHMNLVYNWDGELRNYNFVTLDGLKWAFSPWDMDNTFGMYGELLREDYPNIVTSQFWAKVKRVFSVELLTRYTELMNKKVITVDTVANMIWEFSGKIPPSILKADIERWPNQFTNKPGNYGSVQQMINFYKRRLPYINSHFGYIGT